MPPNERLRSALVTAGITVRQLAEEVGVDPKTVERWVSTGRTP
ncbi:helix-turn-helix domain-containing protein [Streptosporangium saharense]